MIRQPYWLLPGIALVLSLGRPELCLAQDVDTALRQLSNIEFDAEQMRKAPIRAEQTRSRTHVEERLTDGELFLRLKDYVRASVIFTDIVENYPNHTAYPDALFLLGESLFKAGEHLGARSRYRIVIDRADEAVFKPYVQRSLGRLIEIAIHVQDFEGVDAYFVRLGQLPSSEIEASTNYFRAKYLYSVAIRDGESARGEVETTKVDVDKLEQARQAFAAVGQGTPFSAQAGYFVGVTHVLRGQLDEAATAFHRVCKLKAKTEEERKIIGLALIALGRLHYERDKFEPAIEAYQALPRTSPLFDTALYEIAWVYIRMGDSTRAERALELLSVATPDSQHIPDGKLLRGNLLLRDGNFEGASGVFDDVSKQFSPVREELDRLLSQHEDPVAYFQQLVRENLEVFDASAFLPPQALRWTNLEDGEMQRALGSLEDLSQSRQLVAETDGLVARLQAALSSPNPVAVFADSRAHRASTVGLRNRLSQVRKALIAADAKAMSKYGSAELDKVRARRREVEHNLGGAPGKQSVEQRRLTALRQYTVLAKELSRFEVDLLGMEARITATERFIEDTRKTREAAPTEAVLVELRGQKTAVVEYRRVINELKTKVEAGRLQAGIGDEESTREATLRKEHAALTEQERQLLRSLGAQPNPKIDAGFRRVGIVEGALDVEDQQVDVIVAQRVKDMRVVLDEESAKLVGYRTQLAALEGEGEIVVGGIALDNYRKVRQRFYDLVLRADVGGIDVSWAIREEHRARGETLSRERALDLKALEDEFRDIMDQREVAP